MRNSCSQNGVAHALGEVVGDPGAQAEAGVGIGGAGEERVGVDHADDAPHGLLDNLLGAAVIGREAVDRFERGHRRRTE